MPGGFLYDYLFSMEKDLRKLPQRLLSPFIFLPPHVNPILLQAANMGNNIRRLVLCMEGFGKLPKCTECPRPQAVTLNDVFNITSIGPLVS